MLTLQLSDLSDWPLKGPKNDSYKGILPKRMRFVHPSAVNPLRMVLQEIPGIAFSDMYRDPIASLMARKTKVGVQRPGYSGHNYGISVDVDIDQTLIESKLNYLSFLDRMAACGWTCHRSDKSRGSECWHFNLLGMGSNPPSGATGPQLWIQKTYGDLLEGDEIWVQTLLSKLGFYQGEIDGKFGPLSRAALQAFERAYDLDADGVLCSMAMRTLAIVTANKQIQVVPFV